jgi:hypothetical protein
MWFPRLRSREAPVWPRDASQVRRSADLPLQLRTQGGGLFQIAEDEILKVGQRSDLCRFTQATPQEVLHESQDDALERGISLVNVL